VYIFTRIMLHMDISVDMGYGIPHALPGY
jgi:hypothetical protein